MAAPGDVWLILNHRNSAPAMLRLRGLAARARTQHSQHAPGSGRPQHQPPARPPQPNPARGRGGDRAHQRAAQRAHRASTRRARSQLRLGRQRAQHARRRRLLGHAGAAQQRCQRLRARDRRIKLVWDRIFEIGCMVSGGLLSALHPASAYQRSCKQLQGPRRLIIISG